MTCMLECSEESRKGLSSSLVNLAYNRQIGLQVTWIMLHHHLTCCAEMAAVRQSQPGCKFTEDRPEEVAVKAADFDIQVKGNKTYLHGCLSLCFVCTTTIRGTHVQPELWTRLR
jgi:hypothetical protein